ncbi:hypothetical protein [Methylobacterium sp. A54F]
MPALRPRTIAGPLLAAGLLAAGQAAAGEAAERHAAWRGCLQRNFGLQATLTSRVLAADGALRACTAPEAAYFAALAASPLLDADDMGQARVALLARARGWLLGRRTSSL